MKRHSVRAVLAGISIALACSSSDSSPMGPTSTIVDDVRVSLFAQSRNSTITIDLRILNLGAAPRSVRFAGTCNPGLEVYDPNTSADRPVWDERAWRADLGSCIPIIRNADLVAGGSTGVQYQIRHDQILGDSLAPGVYRLVVAFTMVEPAAALELDGGSVRLER